MVNLESKYSPGGEKVNMPPTLATIGFVVALDEPPNGRFVFSLHVLPYFLSSINESRKQVEMQLANYRTMREVRSCNTLLVL